MWGSPTCLLNGLPVAFGFFGGVFRKWSLNTGQDASVGAKWIVVVAQLQWNKQKKKEGSCRAITGILVVDATNNHNKCCEDPGESLWRIALSNWTLNSFRRCFEPFGDETRWQRALSDVSPSAVTAITVALMRTAARCAVFHLSSRKCKAATNSHGTYAVINRVIWPA